MHTITLTTLQTTGLTTLIIWELVWKGIALWRAAQQKDKAWFIVLLIFNSAGLLPILYMFIFSKREQNGK